ncbi:Uncharacterised protein [Chlamydia trachomatis]|nr:Uncharacterised protein [Chlamydia trachomatis]
MHAVPAQFALIPFTEFLTWETNLLIVTSLPSTVTVVLLTSPSVMFCNLKFVKIPSRAEPLNLNFIGAIFSKFAVIVISCFGLAAGIAYKSTPASLKSFFKSCKVELCKSLILAAISGLSFSSAICIRSSRCSSEAQSSSLTV